MIVKEINISKNSEEIVVSYKMSGLKHYISSVRLGNLTLSPVFSNMFNSYSCQTGGNKLSNFPVTGSFEQSNAATTFVSSSRGFSATSGELILDCLKNKLIVSWDPSECSPLTFIDHRDGFSRISFSICEIDETSRETVCYGDFQFRLGSSN